MALVFSPLGEDTLLEQPRALHPKHAFVMRQLGDPPATDVAMTAIVEEVFRGRGYGVKDADASTGAKDFLARILALIRGTGFTVAVFSGQTRPTAMANIALELGFALMCGKPLIIVKSNDAKAPSDLTRTDWIDFDPADEPRFRRKLDQALDEIEQLAAFTDDLLEIAMAAPAMDCAVAFERASRAFLLTGAPGYLDNIDTIAGRLALDARGDRITDLERVRDEVMMFARLGRRTLANADPAAGRPRRRRAAAAAA